MDIQCRGLNPKWSQMQAAQQPGLCSESTGPGATGLERGWVATLTWSARTSSLPHREALSWFREALSWFREASLLAALDTGPCAVEAREPAGPTGVPTTASAASLSASYRPVPEGRWTSTLRPGHSLQGLLRPRLSICGFRSAALSIHLTLACQPVTAYLR